MGLASYYCRFAPHLATIAALVHHRTKKDTPFEWNDACATAFCELKSLLTKAPVLVWRRTHIFAETDANIAESEARR